MLRFITSTIFFISIILFFSVYLSPEYFPYAGLLTLLIPPLIFVNGLIFILLLLAKRRLALLPLLAILIGWKFVGITFQLNPINKNPQGLSVLSYNVHLLSYAKQGGDRKTVTQNITKWLKDN